jgi:hypothetical protein
VATPTLANSLYRPLFADTQRPFARTAYPKSQPEFRVFPGDRAEYHWRIVALATDRTVSRHNSLPFAVKKCTRLNRRREQGSHK